MNKDSIKYLVVGGLVAVVLLVIFVLWRYGGSGLWNMLKYIMWGLLIIGIIGVVVLAVIWAFGRKKIDLVAVHKDNIVDACKLNAHPFKQKLYMQSHGDNWSIRYVGEVIGTCMIKAAPKRVDRTKKGEEQKLEVHPEQKSYDNLLFITFNKGFLNRLLGLHEVVMGTPDDFGNLSGDIVWLKGMTFAPKLYGLLFLSHHWESRHLIDETITSNIYRYTIQENLKELATMMEDAIDASPSHKKKQEIQNIQVLPVPGSSQPAK